ncbi:MAG TPA: bifunctional diaminohydroxyphosphoribosylaminopyrimidine deaminase/5-amino-6-(5-phosphoribosylamino)uracil reductase RibD [Aquabacterium sp.]|nr:bifunctional diaminohydroxyphosphoribosylaminopyrimidine deaminase/5-amino-6-(5-phosphoribosylamino)uracil reductase RibD [Aquabacterium sp.]
MPLQPHDEALLLRAVTLAEQSIGLSDPNPRVGCVLHTADGSLAGEGFTQQAGGPHAEVMAMRAAVAAGRSLAGGTAWVSLEPCAHHGRTPPCADALIAAGLARVVVALTDPYDQVAGRGIARLRAAGITVDLADAGPARDAAQALNIGFLSRVVRGRPWVRMKLAASLDGRTALPDGRSQWITGAAARADGHAWRRRAQAVLTGIGTVLADDPQLDVRLVPTQRQPLRVVVDSRLNLPPAARMLAVPGGVLVIAADHQPQRQAALQAAGAQVRLLPGPAGRVDLAGLLAQLASEGVGELHIEAGATLNGALLAAGLVDELLVYTAPMLIGPGRPLAGLPLLPALDQAPRFQFTDARLLDTDLRLLLRRPGADAFLRHAPGT